MEMVRRIPGISDTGSTPALQAEWNGKIIRALDPISLLACKLELAATISQEKRQDVAHLKILFLNLTPLRRRSFMSLPTRSVSFLVSGTLAQGPEFMVESSMWSESPRSHSMKLHLFPTFNRT